LVNVAFQCTERRGRGPSARRAAPAVRSSLPPSAAPSTSGRRCTSVTPRAASRRSCGWPRRRRTAGAGV